MHQESASRAFPTEQKQMQQEFPDFLFANSNKDEAELEHFRKRMRKESVISDYFCTADKSLLPTLQNNGDIEEQDRAANTLPNKSDRKILCCTILYRADKEAETKMKAIP